MQNTHNWVTSVEFSVKKQNIKFSPVPALYKLLKTSYTSVEDSIYLFKLLLLKWEAYNTRKFGTSSQVAFYLTKIVAMNKAML